jgi:mono/diheme cytochrome c family protein
VARSWWTWGGLGVVGALVAVQLVPYRPFPNPPGRVEPVWDAAETRALAARACFDCHSNETVWPWYSHVAPLAWLVRDHVEEGRAHLNLSAWDQPQEDAGEAAEVVQEGEMPPAYYLRLHPEARLTGAERAALVAGLRASLGGEGRARGAVGEVAHGGSGVEDDDD